MLIGIFFKGQVKGNVTWNDLQQELLAKHSVAMLEQSCNHSRQSGNFATLCCTKNRRCESSGVTSP